jgi:mono/diheme cytochrome c family protein
MNRMLFMVLVAVAAGTAAAEMPNLERGRALYENHCRVCHTTKVHGRVNRLPINATELRQIVDTWQREEKLRWTDQEVDDVVYFLRRTQYNF